MLYSLGIKPRFIRSHATKSRNSRNAEIVAQMVTKALSETETLQYGGGARHLDQENKTTLLVIDRSFDLETPVMQHLNFGDMLLGDSVHEGELKTTSGSVGAKIEVEIERAEMFGYMRSAIGDEDNKLYVLREDNAAWQALRFQFAPLAVRSFKELREELDHQYGPASKVHKMMKDEAFDKSKMDPAQERAYYKGVKEFMPFSDKHSNIQALHYAWLLSHDRANKVVAAQRDRREDLVQFEQSVVMGSAECFQGGDEDCAESIPCEEKLRRILCGREFSKEEREEAALVYYAQHGESGLTQGLREAIEECDKARGTSCMEFVRQFAKIRASESKASPADHSRRKMYQDATWHFKALQDPKDTEAVREAKKVKLPMVKDSVDVLGLAAVSNVNWPTSLLERNEENGYGSLLHWLDQGLIFNSWVPRLYDICDRVINEEVAPEECPYQYGEASAKVPKKSSSARWGKQQSQKAGDDEKPALIVFIIGGICHQEIQAVYELINKHKRDIYIGSTHMSNPKVFTEGLRHMAGAGVASRANSPRSASSEANPFDGRSAERTNSGGAGNPFGGPDDSNGSQATNSFGGPAYDATNPF